MAAKRRKVLKRGRVLIHEGNAFGEAPLKRESVALCFDANWWLHVEDALPPYGKEVLVTCGEEVGHCARAHTDVDGEHWLIVGTSDEFMDVVGWMTVPEIPDWAIALAKKRKRKKP
jgi:hypothetical protein